MANARVRKSAPVDRQGRPKVAAPTTVETAPAETVPSGPRAYRRAVRDRGAETRERLIEAALDVFGRYGFEGATTRQIAKEAGANLAAIVYHFGSKEALHVAVAEHIVERIFHRVAPKLAAAQQAIAKATPAEAVSILCDMIGTYVDLIVGSADAERWARVIVREQMHPSGAFNVIYRAMGSSAEVVRKLVAVASGRPDDEENGIRALSLIGQVLIFRVAHALVLRQMGWAAIGDRERAEIKRTVIGNIRSILRDGAP